MLTIIRYALVHVYDVNTRSLLSTLLCMPRQILIAQFYLHSSCLQVQAQLYCSGAKYCDFIVYTKQGLYVERILLDEKFMAVNLPKARNLFETGVLLELLGHWFSRPSATDISTSSTADENQKPADSGLRYCYCQEEGHGTMVGCDNNECRYQWFHLGCLNLPKPPKAKLWFCPDCRKLDKCKKRRKAEYTSELKNL